MKLAIADPPYLGRADRWYGDGRGHFNKKRNSDYNPEASLWDTADAHRELVERLVADYDGFAIAMSADSLPLYLDACPPDVRTMVWHRGNAIPSGARVANSWEPVVVRIPKSRRGRTSGLACSDVLNAGVPNLSGFVGSKPPSWTRWVLAVLDYRPSEDTLDDLFPGSGAIAAAADGLLAMDSVGARS